MLGVIFDLDGTLLNTLEDIVDSANNVLSRMGIEVLSKEKYMEFIGDGVKELFRKVLDYRGITEEDKIQTAVNMMKEEYSKNYLRKTKPYDGIYDVLSYIDNRNYKMAVLSNKQHFFTQELVKHFFGNFNFIEIIGIENQNDRKPNPRLAMKIVDTMGLDRNKIFFVGDSATDILTAKNCNVKSIGVTWGFKSIEEILSSNPDYIVNKPKEIIEILESNI